MGPSPESKGRAKKDPAPSSARSVEETLARDIGATNPADVIRACDIIAAYKKRHLDEEALHHHAVTPLVLAIATTTNAAVRGAALGALTALSPDVASGARNLLRVIDQGLAKRRAASYAAVDPSTEFSLPYAEQLIITARWVTEAVFQARAFPDNPVRAANGAAAHIILAASFGGVKVHDLPESLASFRTTLPRDLREAQEGLDSLSNLKLIPTRVEIGVNLSSANGAGGGIDPQKMVERTNYLLRSLAREQSYESASIIVQELGRIGDRRSIQALRQAAMGLVSDGGGLVSFRHEAQRLDFQRECRRAEKSIGERHPE